MEDSTGNIEQLRADIRSRLALYKGGLEWVKTTIANHLPRPIGGPVAHLAVGNALEAMFTHDIAGVHPIFLFDTGFSEMADGVSIGYEMTYVYGPRGNIQVIPQIVDAVGQFPDTIIIRHPRIWEAHNKQNILIADWWLNCIADWVFHAQKNGSQVMITTYTKYEAELITQRVRDRYGIELEVTENDVAPADLQRMYDTPRGTIKAQPDQFVIAVDFKKAE